MKNAFEYEAELTALREELAEYQKILLSYKNSYVTKLAYNAVQSSLTAAEQQNAELTDCVQEALTELTIMKKDIGFRAHTLTVIEKLAALLSNPTESGASHDPS